MFYIYNYANMQSLLCGIFINGYICDHGFCFHDKCLPKNPHYSASYFSNLVISNGKHLKSTAAVSN